MSVSVKVHEPGREGATSSRSARVAAKQVDPIALVQAAQREVTAASDEMVAILDELAAAMRNLAAIEPPGRGAAGTVEPAKQQLHDQRLRDACVRVARGNHDLQRVSSEFRNAMKSLDRANMMLPAKRDRDEAQRGAFAESKQLAEVRQRRVDVAMRNAISASSKLEVEQPNIHWAWDTVRKAGRDVNDGAMRLVGYLGGTRSRMERPAGDQQQPAGRVAVPSRPVGQDKVAAKRPTLPQRVGVIGLPLTYPTLVVAAPVDEALDGRAASIEAMLVRGAVRPEAAAVFDWSALRAAANAVAIASLLRQRGCDASALGLSEAEVWHAAADTIAPNTKITAAFDTQRSTA